MYYYCYYIIIIIVIIVILIVTCVTLIVAIIISIYRQTVNMTSYDVFAIFTLLRYVCCSLLHSVVFHFYLWLLFIQTPVPNITGVNNQGGFAKIDISGKVPIDLECNKQ